MDISRPKRTSKTQLIMFDIMLSGHGSIRYAIGEFYEDLTAKVFGGVRHVCDSRADYCPDVSIGGRLYLECKSAGRSGKVLVYAGRIDKDWDFAMKHQLFYVIWCHDVQRAADYKSVEDLYCALLLHTLWCAVVPFDEMFRLCKFYGRRSYKSEYGKSSSSGLYESLHTIPIRDIKPWKLLDWEIDEQAVQLCLPRYGNKRQRRQVGSAASARST